LAFLILLAIISLRCCQRKFCASRNKGNQRKDEERTKENGNETRAIFINFYSKKEDNPLYQKSINKKRVSSKGKSTAEEQKNGMDVEYHLTDPDLHEIHLTVDEEMGMGSIPVRAGKKYTTLEEAHYSQLYQNSSSSPKNAKKNRKKGKNPSSAAKMQHQKKLKERNDELDYIEYYYDHDDDRRYDRSSSQMKRHARSTQRSLEEKDLEFEDLEFEEEEIEEEKRKRRKYEKKLKELENNREQANETPRKEKSPKSNDKKFSSKETVSSGKERERKKSPSSAVKKVVGSPSRPKTTNEKTKKKINREKL
jgi:hypothetical protein